MVLPQDTLGQVLGDDGALGRPDHALGQSGDVTGEAVDDVVEFVGGDGPVAPAVAFCGLADEIRAHQMEYGQRVQS
ncbi:hypothetical protein [Kitasatospora sp. NPDC047058]|uniref:hypothetical protein n=1 Tax=Kitasatospora sp. NPDC047058 TaxID=3155620 RepID=UPI0033C998B6